MRVRRLLAVPSFLILVLAACSAGASTTPAAATPTSAASSAAAAASASESAAPSAGAAVGEIDAEDSSLGKILVDDQGMTIYIFSTDSQNKSSCTGDCLANWPPVVADTTPEAGGDVTATLGTFMRDDGTSQLTVNGFPAYYFAGDSKAGDTNGQGLFDKWFVFDPAGKPIKAAASSGGKPRY
jgi:predicted lipoprotein with Yx(FWY)xxD motif